jgi:hypothetical protein
VQCARNRERELRNRRFEFDAVHGHHLIAARIEPTGVAIAVPLV